MKLNNLQFLFVSIFFVLVVFFVVKRPGNFSDSKNFGKWIGQPVPMGDLWDMNEKKTNLLDFFKNNPSSKNDKKVVVSLWATWCEPCIEELMDLQKSKKNLEEKKIEVILVNYDGGIPQKTIPEVRAWLVAQGLVLETLFDFNEYLLRDLGVYSLPFSFGVQVLFDSPNQIQTKIDWLKNRALNWDRLEF